ncbi:PilW family protein [Pseudomonas benzopyrenica]|uniref:PilW family protein n=1 Tax=Pseudomonas benzopyrenica TaxID=2993566 RepID=UPI0039C2C2B3
MSSLGAHRQRGLSIIELMIAMLLGLLLMGGVLQLFLSSKRTYQTNTALSQVQESGRFALEFLAFDVRNAGYRGGCLTALTSLLPSSLTQQADATDDIRYVLTTGIQGWSTASNTNDQTPNKTPEWLKPTFNARTSDSDVIFLAHAVTPAGVLLTGATATQISTSAGLPQNRLLIISDPLSCHLFANQSTVSDSRVSLATGKTFSPHDYSTTIAKNTSSSTSPNTNGDMAQLLLYQSVVYYLKDNSDTGVPSLWRRVYNGLNQPAEELVSGVQRLQIRYATATSNGSLSTSGTGIYKDASDITDWQSVVSARIRLLAVSRERNAVTPNQQLTFNDPPVQGVDPITIADGRIGQVFTLTVSIRNHLP